MYMSELKKHQEILDNADPFFLEFLYEKNEQQLDAVANKLHKELEIASRLNKPLSAIHDRIKVVETIQQMRLIKEIIEKIDNGDDMRGIVLV